MSRYVLAFDTATEQVAIALGVIEGTSVNLAGACDLRAPRAALGRLLPSAYDLLAESGIGVRDLAAIVVGRGPGSFTGVRIGVATAKGLSHGSSVPLYGVSTLDAVAWNVRDYEGLLGVVGDAMRGEVYPALYRAGGGALTRLTPERVADPATIADEWAELGEPMIIAGNALTKYADVFHRAGQLAPESQWPVSGEGVLAAYVRAVADGTAGSGDPGVLLPVYTRLSDAEENERIRAGLDLGRDSGPGAAAGASAGSDGDLPDCGVAGPQGGER